MRTITAIRCALAVAALVPGHYAQQFAGRRVYQDADVQYADDRKLSGYAEPNVGYVQQGNQGYARAIRVNSPQVSAGNIAYQQQNVIRGGRNYQGALPLAARSVEVSAAPVFSQRSAYESLGGGEVRYVQQQQQAVQQVGYRPQAVQQVSYAPQTALSQIVDARRIVSSEVPAQGGNQYSGYFGGYTAAQGAPQVETHEIHSSGGRRNIHVEEYRGPAQVIRVHESAQAAPRVHNIEAPPEPSPIVRIVSRDHAPHVERVVHQQEGAEIYDVYSPPQPAEKIVDIQRGPPVPPKVIVERQQPQIIEAPRQTVRVQPVVHARISATPVRAAYITQAPVAFAAHAPQYTQARVQQYTQVRAAPTFVQTAVAPVALQTAIAAPVVQTARYTTVQQQIPTQTSYANYAQVGLPGGYIQQTYAAPISYTGAVGYGNGYRYGYDNAYGNTVFVSKKAKKASA